MLPLTIKDMVGYGKLAAMLLSTEEIPWFSRIRIILRDNANEPMIESGIYKSDFVLVKQVDFSPKAMEAAITAELKNNGIGLEQRAQLMVQLASMDYSHQRYNEAISKYKELLAYFQQTTNLPFQSLVMNGLGDVYRRANKPRLAIEWYERALVPAADSKSPVILFSIARNLAHTHFEQGEFDRAEIYFDGAQQLGPVTNDPEARMLSLEWRGLCQQEQAILEKAFESFKLATLEAREFKRDEHFQRNLSHMQRSIEMMDDSSLRTQCLRELLVLEKESDMGNSAPMRELHTS
jgi:tetratricopeptide (TPR) repeat protein